MTEAFQKPMMRIIFRFRIGIISYLKGSDVAKAVLLCTKWQLIKLTQSYQNIFDNFNITLDGVDTHDELSKPPIVH